MSITQIFFDHERLYGPALVAELALPAVYWLAYEDALGPSVLDLHGSTGAT